MADFKKNLAKLLVLALLVSSLSGCMRTKVSKPSETGGVGRFSSVLEPDSGSSPDNSGYTPPPLDSNNTSDNSNQGGTPEDDEPGVGRNPAVSEPDEISYKIENGKYVYHFPKPDRSGLSDLSGLKSMSRALFPDQGDDTTGSWWFGKVTRDLNTGEVTYVWDRSAETIELIKKYDGIYRQHEDEKVCYLTFDCGYENGCTDVILDALKAKNAPGTFFVTGQYVDTAGDQIKRMINEGHIIGNHTENHINATSESPEDFIKEIESVENKMYELYGYDTPMIYWRPPMGGCSEYVLSMAKAMGLHTVLWSYAYYDYDENNQMDYYTALEKAKTALHNGCVYLLHAVSKTNSEMLGDLIDWIRAQGYEIRPLCG